MNNIPNDVLLDVVEYAGKGYPFGISDREIIERIHRYDPEFDYGGWIIQTNEKKAILSHPTFAALNDIYNFITSNKLVIDIGYHITDLYVDGITNPSQIDYLVNTMKQIGYPVTRTKPPKRNPARAEEDVGWLLQFSHDVADQLIPDLALVWTWRQRRGKNPYNEMVAQAKENGYDNLIDKVDVLDTPLSLAGYLRHVIDRSRMLNKIEKYKAYSLYQILSPYRWKMEPDEDEFLLHAWIPISDVNQIRDELLYIMNSNVRVTSDQFDTNDHIFITKTSIPELMEIDAFYHPYAIYSFDQFK